MQSINDATQLLDAEEVAARLGVTKEHARRMLRRGELPALKIGRVWRVPALELAKWVEANTIGAVMPKPK